MGTMNSRARGVSLLESMISLLIFLIISVGWMSLEANLTKTSTDGQIIAQAVFVGQSQVERLREAAFASLVSSTATTYYDGDGNPADADADGLIFGIDYTVTTIDADDNLRRVQVTVSWNITNELQDTLQLYLTRAR